MSSMFHLQCLGLRTTASSPSVANLGRPKPAKPCSNQDAMLPQARWFTIVYMAMGQKENPWGPQFFFPLPIANRVFGGTHFLSHRWKRCCESEETCCIWTG